MTRRGVLAAAATAGALVLLAPASQANAIPVPKDGYQYNMVYYADQAHTTVVGGYTIFCDRSRDDFGSTSRYFQVTQIPCGGQF